MGDLRLAWQRNWPYMLIAFALSVALWFSMIVEAPTQQAVPADLVVVNKDERYVLVSTPPERADITVRGRGRDLLRLWFNRPRLVYTVDVVRSRVDDVELRPEMVALAEGVDAQVVDVKPARLELRFEPLRERSVAVGARVEAVPAEGYALAGPVKIAPARILVRGPESGVAKVDSLFTMPLRLEGIDATVVRDVQVELPDDVGGSLELAAATVRVEVPVEPAVTRVLRNLPVRLVGPGAALLRPSPSRVSVTLWGPESAVSRVTPGDLEARVRVRGREQAGAWLAVEVRAGNPYVEAAVTDSVRVLARRS